MAVAAVLAATVPGCATNPVTGKNELALISTDREIKMGESSYLPAQQMQGGLYTVDPGVTAYVREVGTKLATASGVNLPYEFVVLNSSVPNAWAMPGGKLAVNRGLLTELNSEAELAAVLGHEITHAAGRHGAQAMQRGMLTQVALLGVAIGTSRSEFSQVLVGGAGAAAGLIGLRYGRDAEREADFYGTRYLAKAGYDPMAAVSLQETFVRLSESEGKEQQSWLDGLLASHPASAERVANNRKIAEELKTQGLAGTEIGKERYERAMAALREDAPAYKAADDARKAMSEEKYEEASALVRKAIALEDREASFHGLLGDLERRERDFPAAIKAYDAAIQRDPEYFAYYLGRGVSRKATDPELARSDFERSVKLLPTAIAYNELGAIAEANGDVDQALKLFEAAGQSDSPAGRAARASAMRLDLPRNPGRYVEAHVERDGRGRLLLAVRNPTSVPLTDVAVRVDTLDNRGQQRSGTRTFRRVEPGATEWTVLMQDATAISDARAGVVGARAVE
jgi:predicted Zn-dependent protease